MYLYNHHYNNHYTSQNCIPPHCSSFLQRSKVFHHSTTIDITKPQHVTTIPLNGRQGLSVVKVACCMVFEFPADPFRNFQTIAGQRAATTVGFAIEGTSYILGRSGQTRGGQPSIYTFDGEIFIYSRSFSVAPVPLEQHHASVYPPSDHPEHRCQQSVSSSPSTSCG